MQDSPCVRSRTFLVLRTGRSFCSHHEICICHFLVNLADRLRIWVNCDQICTIAGTIGQIRQKVAHGFFRVFFCTFFPKPTPKRPCRMVHAEWSVPKGSRRKVPPERFTPKGSCPRVHDVEFSERIIFERGHIKCISLSGEIMAFRN